MSVVVGQHKIYRIVASCDYCSHDCDHWYDCGDYKYNKLTKDIEIKVRNCRNKSELTFCTNYFPGYVKISCSELPKNINYIYIKRGERVKISDGNYIFYGALADEWKHVHLDYEKYMQFFQKINVKGEVKFDDNIKIYHGIDKQGEHYLLLYYNGDLVQEITKNYIWIINDGLQPFFTLSGVEYFEATLRKIHKGECLFVNGKDTILCYGEP